MRILTSEVQMEGMSHRSEKKEVKQESLREIGPSNSNDTIASSPVSVVGISQDASVMYDQHYEEYSHRNSDVYSFEALMKAGSEASLRHFTDTSFVEQSLSLVFAGDQAARFLTPTGFLSQADRVSVQQVDTVSVQNSVKAPASGPAISVSGAGLIQFKQYMLSDINQTHLFNGHGTVTTADGRVINFGLYLAMDRQERIETKAELLVQSRPMNDPLVINFGAETVQLQDRFFHFDIDGDGVTEQLGTLAKGSGYLVFDRNHNGRVDDGTELFGPQTGSGFGELAQYDSDENLWLDENDPVFRELQVWVSSETGEDRLMSLSNVGVGAIYLGASNADFDLMSPEGLALGRLKANGIYLTEAGEVRSIQEIDLVDHSPPQSSIVMMTAEQMNEQLSQSQLFFNRESVNEQDNENQRSKPVISDISMAIQRLEQLREDQKAFGQSLKQDEPVSVLSRLVEALKETLERSRESQSD